MSQQDKKCIEEEEGYPLGNKSEVERYLKGPIKIPLKFID